MGSNVSLTVQKVFQWIGLLLTVLIIIGFFVTPFDKGNAVIVSNELLEERSYTEMMYSEIEKFTNLSLEIKKANEEYNGGKIVSMKMAQIYSINFETMNKSYTKLSKIEVPERFRQFHTTFLDAMNYQGMAINEYLVYLKDHEVGHQTNIEKYNTLFIDKYNTSINMFNRLLDERQLK